MIFFFEPKYKLSKIEEFLNDKSLSDEEYLDLHHHSKVLVLTRIVDLYLDSLKNPADKSYFISLIKEETDPEDIHNFLSIKVTKFSFQTVIKELEEEVLLVLNSD